MAVFNVSSSAELQSALTTAQGNGSDDVIQIAQGTYVGNFVYASTQANDLSILGGYSTDFNSRDVDASNTILDGDASNGVIVLMATTVVSDFTIDGLTIQNGSTSGLYGKGGGIRVESQGQISLTNNILINNTSYDGSGAYIEGDVTFSNNTVSSNTATHTGTVTINAGNATITNNTITNNSAQYFGGIDVDVNSSLDAVITNNVVSSNDGTGIYVDCLAVITNNTVSNNGSGIMINNGGTIINNLISDNTDFGISARGGYLTKVDGVITGSAVITGNTIVNNDTGLIFSLNFDEEKVEITNNLFYGHKGLSTSGYTATNNFSDLIIVNDSNDNYIPSTVVLTNNNFDQSTDGIIITIPFSIDDSNLNSVDPLFVDAANGDYRLSSSSPVIDQGVATDNTPSVDLDGNTRTAGSAIDIGAYEYQTIKLKDFSINLWESGSDTGTSVAVESSWIAGRISIDNTVTFDAVKLSVTDAYDFDINISDAIDVLRHIVDLEALTADTAGYHAADVDNDGNINISDAIDILRHIVDLETIDTFDLLDSDRVRVTQLDAEASGEAPTWWKLVANGDVDMSGSYDDDYVVQADIV
jgi:hypothetical protein